MASCGHRRFTNMPLADSRTGATRGRTCQWRAAVLGDRAGGAARPGGGLWPPASGRSASLASVLSSASPKAGLDLP
jgi:hypothetical protein